MQKSNRQIQVSSCNLNYPSVRLAYARTQGVFTMMKS